MRDTDWMGLCQRHFTAPAFEATVRQLLDAIRHASSATERARRAAELGGFLRRERSHARMLLAAALMKDLAIEPTQHVASVVMSKAFGTAASTASLDAFALPGRDASEKHMTEARIALARCPEQVEAYGNRYSWYCRELKKHIARLRAAGTSHPRKYMLDSN